MTPTELQDCFRQLSSLFKIRLFKIDVSIRLLIKSVVKYLALQNCPRPAFFPIAGDLLSVVVPVMTPKKGEIHIRFSNLKCEILILYANESYSRYRFLYDDLSLDFFGFILNALTELEVAGERSENFN